MKVKCSNCNVTYDIPDEKIPEKGVVTKCKNCQNMLTIKKDNKYKELDEFKQKETSTDQNKKEEKQSETTFSPKKVNSGIKSSIKKYVIEKFEDFLVASVVLIFIACIFGCISFFGLWNGTILGGMLAFAIVIPTFGFIFTIIDMKESLQKIVYHFEKSATELNQSDDKA